MAGLWSNELRFYLGAYDLSGMSVRASIELAAPVLDRTSFVDAAEFGTADIRRDAIEWAGWFDDQAEGIDALIGTLIGTRGDVLSFFLGTGTGDRAYSGTLFVAAVKPSGNVGELVRVEGNYKPDQSFDVCKHFGPKTTITTSGTTHGSVDDSAASTGTHQMYSNLTIYTTGTVRLDLQDSADGTAFTSLVTANYTAIGSKKSEFTGTLRRYVRVVSSFLAGSGSGTAIYVMTYKR